MPKGKGLQVKTVKEEPVGTVLGLKPVDVAESTQDYSRLFMQGETLLRAYKSYKDVVLVTDKRIILTDTKGSKYKPFFESIFINNLVEIDLASENGNIKAHKMKLRYGVVNHVKASDVPLKTKILEFDKAVDVSDTYTWLLTCIYNRSLITNQ